MQEFVGSKLEWDHYWKKMGGKFDGSVPLLSSSVVWSIVSGHNDLQITMIPQKNLPNHHQRVLIIRDILSNKQCNTSVMIKSFEKYMKMITPNQQQMADCFRNDFVSKLQVLFKDSFVDGVVLQYDNKPNPLHENRHGNDSSSVSDPINNGASCTTPNISCVEVYKTKNDISPAFSVVLIHNAFSYQFCLDFWNSIKNIPFVPCTHGRLGSALRFVTDQAMNHGKMILPIGSGGRIAYYQSTAATRHETAFLKCLNYIYNVQLQCIQECYSKNGQNGPISLPPMFVTMLACFYNPSTNPGFGPHDDCNETLIRTDDETMICLPTRELMQTPTIVMGDPAYFNTPHIHTQYLYKNTDSKRTAMKHEKILVPLNCITWQGPGSQDESLHEVVLDQKGKRTGYCNTIRISISGRTPGIDTDDICRFPFLDRLIDNADGSISHASIMALQSPPLTDRIRMFQNNRSLSTTSVTHLGQYTTFPEGVLEYLTADVVGEHQINFVFHKPLLFSQQIGFNYFSLQMILWQWKILPKSNRYMYR